MANTDALDATRGCMLYADSAMRVKVKVSIFVGVLIVMQAGNQRRKEENLYQHWEQPTSHQNKQRRKTVSSAKKKQQRQKTITQTMETMMKKTITQTMEKQQRQKTITQTMETMMKKRQKNNRRQWPRTLLLSFKRNSLVRWMDMKVVRALYMYHTQTQTTLNSRSGGRISIQP